VHPPVTCVEFIETAGLKKRVRPARLSSTVEIDDEI
jgi:hypothetical protein